MALFLSLFTARIARNGGDSVHTLDAWLIHISQQSIRRLDNWVVGVLSEGKGSFRRVRRRWRESVVTIPRGWYSCVAHSSNSVHCLDVNPRIYEELLQKEMGITVRGCYLVYFHVLQLLQIEFTKQNLCFISKSTMKRIQKSDWNLDLPCFSYGYR